MWESIFEWLFKFKTTNYSEGDLILQAGRAFIPYLILTAILIIVFFIIYKIANIYTTVKGKALSLSLKILALILLCLPLFEPSLIMPDIVPNENFLAVLVDGSSSMSIPDGKFGESRLDDIRHILTNSDDGIIPELEENFKIRLYSFSDDISRVDSIGYILGNGKETNYANALERIISDFKGLPLTGIVMLTDGSDNSTDNPLSMVEELRSLNIPLHIVGIGSEQFEQERELLDVTYNKGLKKGAGAEISVKVRSSIEEVEPLKFSMYKDDQLSHTELKNIKGGGKTDHFSFFFEPEENEVSEYTLKIESLPDEINDENNTLNILIDTQSDSIRVLFFEGHPRPDFKFIKRALEGDQVFEFTSMSRLGGDRYYRQGVKHPDELKGGFPKTQEELFEFEAVIFGDIEASYFSVEQLDMIERFVKNRGGGFLMLGAKHSFAEGDYWNTPIDDLLPVIIDPRKKQIIRPDFYNPPPDIEEVGMKFVPTQEGLEHPILKFANDYGTNRAMWDEMPKITEMNYFGGVKPGATVLAEKLEDEKGGTEPLLAIQRYGKGRTAALATSSTWRWQMSRDGEDTRHERFWRQFARWLVSSTPNGVNIDLPGNLYAPGDELEIRVQVFDDNYLPQDFADVEGTITDPFGTVIPIRFRPDLQEEGEYIANFVSQEPGVYEINVEALKDGKDLGKHRKSFLNRPSKKEYFNANLKKIFLQNLTEANDGIYYEPENFNAIPSNLISKAARTSVYRTEYIWDTPFTFLLALLILSVEWVLRRRKGLP
ncbi:glutamine amidotransferase [candidate division KSB1 bacterium]